MKKLIVYLMYVNITAKSVNFFMIIVQFVLNIQQILLNLELMSQYANVPQATMLILSTLYVPKLEKNVY